MNVYIFQAALLCEACAQLTKETIARKTLFKVPADPDDESSYDSDDYPKGPYANGGGEADCPQHCDHCGVFLENVLTDDGVLYVKNRAEKYDPNDRVGWDCIAVRAEEAGEHVLAQWVRHYFALGQ